MMQTRRVALIGLYFAAALVLQGCLLAAVGAGAVGSVAYVKGDLEAIEGHKLDDVYAATKKALEDAELSISQDTKDALSAVVIARDSRDKKVTVKLTATAEGATKLSIRFGTFGSETKSRMIHDKIKENLK